MYDRTRAKYVVVLGALVGSLSLINAVHVGRHSVLIRTVLGAVVPLLMTLVLGGLTVVAVTRGWRADTFKRLTRWVVAGLTWMTIVGVGFTVFASAGGTAPPIQGFLLVTFASYGIIPALITSWIDVQRHQREDTLRQYKQAVEGSKDLLAAVDEDLNFLFANEEYRQYHGIENRDVTGRSLRAVLGEEAFSEIEAEIEAAMEGRPVQTEVAREHPTLGERILDVRLFKLEDSEGGVRGVGATMRDVTEDRQRERAIQRESEYRRIMSEGNLALVGASDIEEMAPKIAEAIGSSPEFSGTFIYLFDQSETAMVCGRDRSLTDRQIESIHTQEYIDTVFESGVLLMEDVTEPPFSQHESTTPSHPGVGIALEYGGERYGILTVHFEEDVEPTSDGVDLLETIGNNLAYGLYHYRIEAEHRTFADIVERIDDPVMLQDCEGNFQVLNEAVTEFTGMDKEALIGRDESAFMDTETTRHVREMKERVLETEEPVSYQVTTTFPDGREHTFSTTRYPYYDDGELSGTIAICRDVTDLKEHQRQLQILDRVLRHNVNNNMNVVRGYAEMIADRAEDDIATYATHILDNSHRLLDISEKQRAITHFLSDIPPTKTIDLERSLERTVDRVRTEYPDAEVTLECPPETHVTANTAIDRAVEELLTNSVVHSDRQQPEVSVNVTRTASTVSIRVADENEPIPTMEREVLAGNDSIDALHHGSGLGLWLVKLIVDHSDGTLRFQKNDPRGNVVEIELQRADGRSPIP